MKEIYTYLFDDSSTSTDPFPLNSSSAGSKLVSLPNPSVNKTTKMQALNIESTDTNARHNNYENKQSQLFQDSTIYNCAYTKSTNGCIIENFNETNFVFILTLDLVMLIAFLIIQVFIILLLFLFK